MTRATRIARLQVQLTARAGVPPPDDWLPVIVAGVRVGTVGPDVASFLATHEPRCALLDYCLVFDDGSLDRAGRTALLADVALRLRDARLLRGWRDEQLDVRPLGGGAPLATMERTACRALGITTFAVHLNGFAHDGRLIVAQRAAHKTVDPGLWDNLVGGMVAAGEEELTALQREAGEEAGFELDQHLLVRGGLVREQRPIPEGHMVEIVQVFDVALPPGFVPHNVDGEVARFEVREIDAVLDAIERDEFTVEAALVTLDALARRAAAA